MAARRSPSTDHATKADLHAVTADLHAVTGELRAEIQAVKTDMQTMEANLADAIRSNGVLIERLDSKITVLVEGLPNRDAMLRAELKTGDDQLAGRVSLLEDVARQHSEDIRLLRVGSE